MVVSVWPDLFISVGCPAVLFVPSLTNVSGIESKHAEVQSRCRIFLDPFVLAFVGEVQSD